MSELPPAPYGEGPRPLGGGDIDPNARVRRTQVLLWGGVGAVFLAIGAFYLFSGQKPVVGGSRSDVAKHMPATVDAATSATMVTPAEDLESQLRQKGDENAALKAQVEALRTEKGQLQTQNQADRADATRVVNTLQRAVETREGGDAALPPPIGSAPGASFGLAGGAPTPAQPRTVRGPNPFAPIGVGRRTGLIGAAQGPAAGGALDGAAAASDTAPARSMQVIRASAVSVKPGDSAGAASGAAKAGAPAKAGMSAALDIYESSKFVPPNAYANAKVLVGVDAATGTTYSADPKPVLFRILGPAVHVGADGRFQTTDLTGCMVNGAAYGELPSEKVYIKLQKITCPAGPGQFSVATVEGYIASHGKAGVRGTVISREGSLTSKAMLAGSLNGLGQAMSLNVQRSEAGTNVGVTGGLLSTKELTPGQIASASVGSGVSGAASMLADYYIKRAEQYQPVIEMPTGIEVELVFLAGFRVK